jgi:hypothetical protein
MKSQRGSRGITPALDESGLSTPRSGRFTPRKETVHSLYRRLGGPQARSGQEQKICLHRDSIPVPSSPYLSLYGLLDPGLLHSYIKQYK